MNRVEMQQEFSKLVQRLTIMLDCDDFNNIDPYLENVQDQISKVNTSEHYLIAGAKDTIIKDYENTLADIMLMAHNEMVGRKKVDVGYIIEAIEQVTGRTLFQLLEDKGERL
jgi:hypothetical protein